MSYAVLDCGPPTKSDQLDFGPVGCHPDTFHDLGHPINF